jgi:hypothetical protein
MGYDGVNETAAVLLMPPTFIGGAQNLPRKTTDDLKAFARKCDFYCALINMFCLMEGNTSEAAIPEHDKLSWRNVFAQPISYPPPESHLLFGKPEALENHIQAFLW